MYFPRYIALLVLSVYSLSIAGCGEQDAMSGYENQIWQHRLDKDMSMRDASRTVLRPEVRARFAGLNYFGVDESYRFEVEFVEAAAPETVLVAKRLGGIIPYVKKGYVEIPFPEGPFRLSAFHLEDTPPNRLWLAFRDGTTGRESYGGGRYIETYVEEDGRVVVDFNLAYNPFCDYNPEDFNCPIPPRENRIPFPVPVGEKRSGLSDISFGDLQ